MIPVYYIGSTGLGENLQAVPAMRHLAGKIGTVTPVIRYPHHLVFQFKEELLNPAIGWPLVYGHKQVVLDRTILEHIKVHANGDFILASHMDIGFAPGDFKKPRVEPRVGVGGVDVVRSIYQSYGGNPEAEPSTFRLSARFDKIELHQQHPDRLVICSGSREHLRCLTHATMRRIADACHGDFNKITILASAARDFPGPEPVKYEVINDEGNDRSLRKSAWAISEASVVISPDSGLSNLALALGKQLVWLESREPAASLISPVCLSEQVHQVLHDAPNCDRQCRARGGPPAEKYPANLACWQRGPAPCLEFTDSHINVIARLAREARPATSPA